QQCADALHHDVEEFAHRRSPPFAGTPCWQPGAPRLQEAGPANKRVRGLGGRRLAAVTVILSLSVVTLNLFQGPFLRPHCPGQEALWMLKRVQHDGAERSPGQALKQVQDDGEIVVQVSPPARPASPPPYPPAASGFRRP